MDKLTLSITILAAIALIGTIVLIAIDKNISTLLPILTALIGALAGLKKDTLVSMISRKK